MYRRKAILIEIFYGWPALIHDDIIGFTAITLTDIYHHCFYKQYKNIKEIKI